MEKVLKREGLKQAEGLEIASQKLKLNEHLFMNAVQEMATGNVKVEGEDVMDLEGDEG